MRGKKLNGLGKLMNISKFITDRERAEKSKKSRKSF